MQIIPDRKEYAVGSTAELLLQAPFYPAEALVSWRRSGIVKVERVRIDGPTKVIAVPITDAMVPNLHVQVDLVGAAARLDDKGAPDPRLPKRPAYAVGSINLPVPPRQRTLAVEVAPSAPKVAPGEQTQLALVVKDAAGQPVADAEVAVIVVDESILGLTGHQFANPIDVLYVQRPPEAQDHYLRAYVKLAKPDLDRLAQGMQAQKGLSLSFNSAVDPSTGAVGGSYGSASAEPPAPPGAPPPADEAEKKPEPSPAPMRRKGEGGEEGQQGQKQQAGGPPIAIRSNFNPLAAFAPAVKTDGAGRATVSVKVPDNLTRYRIVAIATAGAKQFGKGESALVARLPLMVRPSPPRFLNFGDTFQLPVVVQNQTDAPMTVKLAARTTNAALTDGAGREVTVPANDRVEVQFPAAAELAGTARFQIVGSAGKASDAAEVALPVWTPATTEAFATYGVIDAGAMIAAGGATGEGRHAVRRAGGDDGVDEPPGADGRDAVPGEVPVRVRGAAGVAGDGDRGAARRADGVQGQGPAERRGDGVERRGRRRAAVADAEQRRRVRVLAARVSVGAVPDGVRDERAGGGRGRRASWPRRW